MWIASILGAVVLTATISTARADGKAEAHSTLMTVSRWGMCLLEKMGDAQAKGMVMPVVLKVDAKFRAKYGFAATDVARERYGDDFVKRYYEMAKAEHDRLPKDHAAHCASLNQRVVALAQ